MRPSVEAVNLRGAEWHLLCPLGCPLGLAFCNASSELTLIVSCGLGATVPSFGMCVDWHCRMHWVSGGLKQGSLSCNVAWARLYEPIKLSGVYERQIQVTCWGRSMWRPSGTEWRRTRRWRRLEGGGGREAALAADDRHG